jgi:amino acid adenylation domain-containing protein
MLNVPAGTIELPDIAVERMSTGHPEAKFDLSVHVVNRVETISLALVYKTDLYTTATIDRVSRHFACLLEALASNPRQRVSAVPLLDRAAAQRGLPPAPAPVRSFVAFARRDIKQSIAARFEQQAERYARHVAVATDTGVMTYDELDRAANRTARVLLARGMGAGSRIALLFDHDAPMIVGILGALKAGTTYVPLDPLVPAERLRSMLQDADVSAVLTGYSNLRTVLELIGGTLPIVNVDEPDDVPSCRPSIRSHNPEAAAYLLYTSGSTGSPKGVAQSHRNVLHHIRAYTNNLKIDADDKLSLLSTYSCDAAVMDVFGALLNGASLHLFDIRKTGVEPLCGWIARQGITIYHSTPTVFRHFMSTSPSIENCRSVRLVVMGGEEVVPRDVDLFRRHFPTDSLFVNGLGPTESTVTLQYFVDSRAQMTRNRVPVGYPVEDTEILLVNEEGEDTTLLGELVIKSEHVALEYWKRPELTQRVFLPDPEGGLKRLYRTGDIVRRLDDGSLEYVGRRDAQVKIRGHRVELTDIEANILRLETVKEALVMAFEDASGETKLVAYLVGRGAALPTKQHLRQFLRTRIPHYMIPSAIIFLTGLPLTPNGKVDRSALPLPEFAALEPTGSSGTSEEEILCGLFAEVLGVPHVDGGDDVFSLGGHSLQATKLVSRIRARFRFELELREIFEGATVAAIAQRIREGKGLGT